MVIEQDFGPGFWNSKKQRGYSRVSFKSSPTAPSAPDPTTTANAQTASNIATANATAALNHTNQVTPWGNLTYTQGPTNADGTSSYTATTSLSPSQQALLDSSNSISQSLANLGQTQVGNVADSITNPLDFSNLPTVQNNALQTSAGVNPQFKSSVSSGPIQGQVNTSAVPSLVGGNQLAGAMTAAQQASYNQQAVYLNPQWQQSNSDLANKLAQQGVLQGSDAYNRAMSNQSLSQTQAYQNANDNSVAQGNAAEAQLYGQGLSSNQNAYGQAVTNGSFSNAAQAQGFGQNYQNAELGNQVAQNEFNNGLQNAELNNSASGQAYSQSLGARNQGINELLTQQSNPLNILNSLRSGSQVTSPTFGSTPTENVAGTDVAGAINNAFNANLGAYNSQVSQNNAATSGLFGLGGAIGGGLAGSSAGSAALMGLF